MELDAWRRKSISLLRDTGYDDAESTVRLILDDGLGLSPAFVLTHPEAPFDETEANRILKRILGGEPAAYVLGTVNFAGLSLKVTPDVLIPRPETEELADWIIHDRKGRSFRMLDLCTGSGCILTAVLSACPDAEGMGTDLSDHALKVARENLNRHQCDTRAALTAGSMFEAVDPEEQFDVIVSNPPYVTAHEMEELPEVVRKEPRMALYGGRDGLNAYRVIAKEGGRYLLPGGRLYLEIGCSQADQVSGLLTDAGWCGIEVRKDLSGRDRMISAGRKGEWDV